MAKLAILFFFLFAVAQVSIADETVEASEVETPLKGLNDWIQGVINELESKWEWLVSDYEVVRSCINSVLNPESRGTDEQSAQIIDQIKKCIDETVNGSSK